MSFTFISDHEFLVPMHDYRFGTCLSCYNFESTETPKEVGEVSTYQAKLQARFAVPFDEDTVVVATYGLEIESDPPALSRQPSGSRRAGLTAQKHPPRKFYPTDPSPLIAMRFAYAYSDENEENDAWYLLVAHASAFSDRVPEVLDTFLWREWAGEARLTQDGVPFVMTDRRHIGVYACNVSASRVVVIDRKEKTAGSVRVLDFSPARLRHSTPIIVLPTPDPDTLQSSTPMKVVTNQTSDAQWLELVRLANEHGGGLAFSEVTMLTTFDFIVGAILLEEQLFVLVQVSPLLSFFQLPGI